MGKRMRKKNALVKEVSGGSEWRLMTARTDGPFNRALMATSQSGSFTFSPQFQSHTTFNSLGTHITHFKIGTKTF